MQRLELLTEKVTERKNHMAKKIILASGSPRRKQLLLQAGIPHEVLVSNVDETVAGLPGDQTRTLARRKAMATASLLTIPREHAIIIAADTLVNYDGEIMGKPTSPNEAYVMLQKLQGKTHQVYTGVSILAGDDSIEFTDMAEVTFRPLSHEEMIAYIATKEPFDKAGAYGIQGRGSAFVRHISGDFYTVMGLPISKVCGALIQVGYNYWSPEQ